MPGACFAILMTGLDLVELTADLSCGSEAMDILNVVVFSGFRAAAATSDTS